MNVFREFRGIVIDALDGMGRDGTVPPGLDTSRVTLEPPRDPSHGDVATNAAMVLAKPAGMKPRDLAVSLADRLTGQGPFFSAEVAGPGFINLRAKEGMWREQIRHVLQLGQRYGDSTLFAGRRINVEYVSANPTGPLHAAHARGAVVGDALAALLEKAGYEVFREYYINDAGAQVDTLARSAHLRYREALGEDIGEIPSGLYPGEYLKDVGRALADRDGPKWQGAEEALWLPEIRSYTIERMMESIRADLEALDIHMCRFSSERALVDAGGVDAAVRSLKAQGHVYTGTLEPPKGKPPPEDWEPRPQLLFRATGFGDDVDRPLKKSDGSWTYFANDIAYHHDKVQRGYAEMIDVWGADHGGYVKRMKAAVSAITDGKGDLDVKLCQLVHLLDDGKPVRMSKRAGTFVTLADVIESVGPDVLRFIMLTRRNDQTLEFDYAKVTEQSRENPVFYVQYAHARCHSVLGHAADALPNEDLSPVRLAEVPLDSLTDEAELGLIKLMATWPRLVESAAEAHEPHRIAFYLGELAAAFHGLWNKGREDAALRFIIEDDEERTLARLALVSAVKSLIAVGLGLMGVRPVEELRA